MSITKKQWGFIAIAILVIAGIWYTVWYFDDNAYRAGYYEGEYDYAEDGIATESFGLSMNKSSVAAAPPMIMTTDEEARMMMPEPTPGGSVAADVDASERLIIKNGDLSLVVSDVTNAISAIKQFASEKGGFVVSSNINQSGIAPYGTVQIRIPSEVFDSGLDSVRNLGEVRSETVSGRDVTEEYVDLESQLGNYKATEEQFLAIMTKATKIEDILAVQRELTIVRGNIEGIEGRMKYLRESASFSSLSIYLSTSPDALPIVDNQNTWKPLAVAKDALRDLKDVGIGVANAMIWLVVYLPLWIGIIIVLFLLRALYRRFIAHRQQ